MDDFFVSVFFPSLSLISIKYFQFKRRLSSDSFYVNLCRTYTYIFYPWPHVLSMSDIERNVKSLLRDVKSIYSQHTSIMKHKKEIISILYTIDTHRRGFYKFVQSTQQRRVKLWKMNGTDYRHHEFPVLIIYATKYKVYVWSSRSFLTTLINCLEYKIHLGWDRSTKWPAKDNNGICAGNQMQRSRIFLILGRCNVSHSFYVLRPTVHS